MRLAGLDGLRGLLACAVAMNHITGFFCGWSSSVYFGYNTSFAVDIFFVLSGIVLIEAYEKKLLEGRMNVLQYMKARFFRMFPIYFLTTLFIILWCLLKSGKYSQPWIDPAPPIVSFIMNTTMLTNIGVKTFNNINAPGWSVSVEFWIGSVIFLLAVYIRKSIYFLFAVGVYLMFQYSTPLGAKEVVYGVSHGGARCLVYMSLAVILYRYKDFIRYNAVLESLCGFVLLYAIFNTMNTFTYICICPFIVYFCICITKNESIFGYIFENEFVKKLGIYSFSIYLIHYPIIFIMLPLKSEHELFNYFMSIVIMFVCIYISKGFYVGIEKKFIDYGKRITF